MTYTARITIGAMIYEGEGPTTKAACQAAIRETEKSVTWKPNAKIGCRVVAGKGIARKVLVNPNGDKVAA